MSSTLQVIDQNTGTVLYDLNDTAGANSSSYGSVQTDLIADPDFGIPALQQTDTSPTDAEVAYVSFSRFATADCRIRIRIRGTSYDNMNLAVGTLAQYLSQGCTMKWIANGSAETRYLDVLPSATPALLHGQELALNKVTTLFDTPEGVELVFKRQPYLRGDALSAAVNLLTNPTLLRDSNGDGTPDGWSLESTPTVAISTANEALLVTAGAATRGIQQTSVPVTAATTYSAAVDVKCTSGTARLLVTWSGGGTISTTTASTSWTRISASGAASGGSTTATFTVDASGGAATFYVRNAQMEAAAAPTKFRVGDETVSADPSYAGFAKMMPVYNPGTSPAPCVLTAKFTDAAAAVTDVDYWTVSSDKIAGNRYLADFLDGPFYAAAGVATGGTANGWVITQGTDSTAGTAPADAAPYNACFTLDALVTHSTTPTTFLKRVTWTRTTFLDTLRGRHRVYARVKANSASTYRLRLNWGPGGLAQNQNEEYDLDTSAAATQGFVLADLGEIELPEVTSLALGSFTMELWTAMDVGKSAANLYVDYLYLTPADQMASIVAPANYQITTAGKDLTTPPKQLTGDSATWTAGSVSGTSLRLDTATEAVGIGSNTTGAFAGVANRRKKITYDISVTGSNSFTAVCDVANITDDNVTVTTSTSSPGNQLIVLYLDETASKAYQPRVELTVAPAPRVTLNVNSITYEDVSIVTQNQQVRTDPGSTPGRLDAETLDTNSNLVLTMSATRVPFWIPPGLSLIAVEPYNATINNYPEPRSLGTFAFTLTPTVYPRWWV